MVARDEQRRRYTIQATFFKPYFHVKKSAEAEKALLKRGMVFEDGPLGLDDVPTYTVTTKQPQDVGKRRRGFETTYEADVPYTRRFLVDCGIKDGFVVKAAKVLGKDMLIVSRKEDIEPADGFRVPDRQFLYDIETNKPEGSNHYSPAVFAKGAVTCNTIHDTYDGTNFHTFIWHPTKGQKGKPRLEMRNHYSKAFKREVDWYIHWFGSEYEMFEAMIAFTKQRRPDVLSAWNGHRGFKKLKNAGGFDMPYLINRARNLKISPGNWSPMGNAFAGYQQFGKESSKGKWACYVEGIQLVDSMTTRSVKDGGFPAQVDFNDLKRVVKEKLGYEMDKEPRTDLTRFWLEKTDEFLSYNFSDVDAIVGLELKDGYTQWIRDMQQFVGAEDANRLFTPMSLISTLNLRIANHEMKRVVPTANSGDKEVEDDDYSAEGGFVLNPRKTGLQDVIAVLDLSKMYVNVIRSCNISWETWVKDPKDEDLDKYICVPSDLGPQFFVKPEVKVGLMTRSCNYLVQAREVYDDLIEKETDAAKIAALKKARDPAKQLTLAVFGVSLSEFFGLWRKEAGSSITGMGRRIILGVDKHLQQNLDRFMTYGDTDSSLIPLKSRIFDDTMVEEGEALCDSINVWFTDMAEEHGIQKHGFEIGMEAILSPFVQGRQKKQYAAFIRWSEGSWQEKPVMLVKGVPGIKGDAAPITKEVTKTVLHMILSRRPNLEVLDFIRDMYESVLDGQVPINDMVKSVTLNAAPDEILPKPYHVHTAAKNGLAMYDFAYSVGQKVRLVKLKGIEGKKVAIPEGEDIPDGMPIDYDFHADETILGPIRGIMSWIGLDRMLDSIRVGTELTKAMTLE